MKLNKYNRELVRIKRDDNSIEINRLNIIYSNKRKDKDFLKIQITALQMEINYLSFILKQQY